MKILVLGLVKQAHETLIKLGHEVTLLKERKQAKAHDLPIDYKNIVYLANGSPVEDFIAMSCTLHTRENFDAVLAFNDDEQRIAIAIAKALSLPTPVDEYTWERVFNKHLTREMLAGTGLDKTVYHLVQSREELASVIASSELPVIMKPTNGTGSAGITKIESEADIALACTRIQESKNDFPVLIETFHEGKEYSVEAFSEQGEHVILGITEKIKNEDTFLELGHVFPAPLPEDVSRNISQYISQVLTQLGIKNGPSHSEIILTQNGPQLVESHTRAAGDRIFRLVELATGVNIFEYCGRQALGEDVLLELKDKRPYQAAAIKYESIDVNEKCVLKEVRNEEQANSLPGVDELAVLKQPGQRLAKVVDSFGRTAFVVASGKTQQDALNTCDLALNTLSFHLDWS